jgi:hypothetical protein
VAGSEGGDLHLSTPDYTRRQGFPGSTGVVENEKTLVFPGFLSASCFMKPLL